MVQTSTTKKRYASPLCEAWAFNAESGFLTTSTGVGDMPVKPASSDEGTSDLFTDGFNF